MSICYSPYRTEILSRRRERQQRRQELTKRKSAAAQERMRILSMLAKSGNSGPGKKKEDTFGMKDEDWDIYKAVSKVSGIVAIISSKRLTIQSIQFVRT